MLTTVPLWMQAQRERRPTFRIFLEMALRDDEQELELLCRCASEDNYPCSCGGVDEAEVCRASVVLHRFLSSYVGPRVAPRA